MSSLLFEICEYSYTIFLGKSQLWRMVFLRCRIQANSMYGDSVYVLFGESTCGFVCKILAKDTMVATWQGLRDWVTAVLLSGCGWSGWMVMLLAYFVFYVLWARNRREPSNWKGLSLLTVHSLHAGSVEKGEIHLQGPKRSLTPWDGGAGPRAMLTLYIIHTVRQDELPYRHLFVRKIKIIKLLPGH